MVPGQHRVGRSTLRKNRNHFIGQTEQFSIDYHAAHDKSLAELPVLQEQHQLEVEEYQNALEEAVARHVARIAQLRQDYSLMVKEASRRHLELQQRRFAGAKVEVPQPAALQPPSLPPLSPPVSVPGITSNVPLLPLPGKSSAAAAAAHANAVAAAAAQEQAQSHSLGQVHPNAYLKTLDNGAASAMANYSTRPPSTPNALSSLTLANPPPTIGPRVTTPPDPNARGSDFHRLEAMHEKYMSRTRSLHEYGLASRASEVAAWAQTFAACMGALAQHQSSSLSHLAACVEEAEAWHAQQRSALSSAHEEILGEAERLGRQLEVQQSAAASKLAGLLASFLERVLPTGEVGLAEAQAAYTRAAANLRNEHVASLEATEGALRALVPRHAAMRQHMAAAYSAGLAAHEAAMAAAGGHYDSRGIPELRRQYEEAEARHRDALAAIRADHLKGLAASREGWMGEAAALLEEYRARMQELKSQFVLTYEWRTPAVQQPSWWPLVSAHPLVTPSPHMTPSWWSLARCYRWERAAQLCHLQPSMAADAA
ncbi:hypothetical protein VOLCADRAFT_107808 [Volvox carteri f. nagariensis]|uniref:Uncharacterized protein n=1 Tax=Volvox carteri f. nagariensis TaxID=3068 RepID=D8UGK4_VOLCA|nr:uncharacterized protein VOLCADRAFT_107808 [Volvox carteri f. nagariensis]EFJ41138.1 hypothetical protein VOLCADRAFT_107808 [Volvox carteri f. nagariensis]|eukprot:XP_002957810.1 hypothetical protein VOLCADRAFT_107808 [Volvox carteri f. nagariensis]